MKCRVDEDSFVVEDNNKLKLRISFANSEGTLAAPKGNISEFILKFRNNERCGMVFVEENIYLCVVSEDDEVEVSTGGVILIIPYNIFSDAFNEFLNRINI